MFQVKVEWIQRERVLMLVFCRWAHEDHEEANFVEIFVKWNYISFSTLIDALDIGKYKSSVLRLSLFIVR